MKTVYWQVLPFAIFALLVIFFWRGLSLNPQYLPSVFVDKPLPAFQLPDLQVKGQRFDSSLLHGQTALLNVWASWCDSCAQEQVFLMQLAKGGMAIYGLNYKDKPADANNWLRTWGNPYKRIGSDQLGKIALDLGVYGTPETFLLDKQGIIRYRYAGSLDADIWQREFLPRIQRLNA